MPKVLMDELTAASLLPRLAEGMTNGQIAKELHWKLQTVKDYLHALYRWLPAVNRAHAVTVAMRRGLLTYGDQLTIGVTDAAIEAVAFVMVRRSTSGLTKGMAWAEAEMYLMEAAPHLRIVDEATFGNRAT